MASRRNLAAILGLSTVLTSVAFAQTTPSADETEEGYYTLREIIVHGGQTASAPGAVADTPLASTATREELSERQITSIEDLGRSLEPGVNFNRNTGAINIRGLEGPRVLTTIDGIPVPYLNDTTRGSSGGVDLFEFSSLAGIDIVRGSDSSRAGPGALGGVLGLRTLEPDDLIRDGRTWGGVTGLVYDGSDDSFTPSAAVAARAGNTSVLLQGAYRRGNERESMGSLDAYGPTRTLPNPADYDQHNLLFKLRHDLEGGHTVGLTAERFRRDRDVDDRRMQTVGGNYLPGNYASFESGARDRVSLDYRYDGGGFVDFAAASLYWIDQQRGSGYEGIRSSTVRGPIWRDNTYDETTIGFIGSGERTFTIGDFSHRLTMGLDLSGSSSQQYTAGGDNCSVFYERTCSNLHTNQADEPEVDSRKVGFFVDNEIGIGQTGFFITPGARFDWVERDPKMTPEFARNPTRPGLPNSFSDTAVSPKLGLAYRPSDTIELYGQWAMGFRAPTSGELYSTFGGPGTYLRRGNDELVSETSQGIEIGVRYGDEDFGVRASLFHNRYRNFIEAVSADDQNPAVYPFGITEFQNLDRVRISGIEAAVHKRFDNGFHIMGSLAFARGENLETGAYLGSVAPFKGVATVGYAAQTWGTDLTFIGVSGVSDNSDATFKAPGYGIVDVTAWWKPEQLDGFTIRGGVYNLFDKEYYDAINLRSTTGITTANQAYFSEPGRFFKVSLAKEF
ncbi:TonB-dependent hemoglobin/transferrin/lactoferrin family receptor [Aliihoeflea aestuarii]|uniref:TonB-dependent hemoglobin/transferrin/lactoferrin family receptor n=1 Tax=Aliihoeflea aestuarii TaxID=453840 RepID=UPI0020950870|nr:TonB-dependent hemoglobin/transferrin/lactoferrin family receptor [Aliihoeflea aestuarii]MCO6392666.1 TonB-dependent hemoglobin/transferrin/lactoferrin family receptor [Aliihoeflea aestuarii]